VTFDLQSAEDCARIFYWAERGVTTDEREADLAEWVTVLLTLKAAAAIDFDLQNGDPNRTREQWYVDV